MLVNENEREACVRAEPVTSAIRRRRRERGQRKNERDEETTEENQLSRSFEFACWFDSSARRPIRAVSNIIVNGRQVKIAPSEIVYYWDERISWAARAYAENRSFFIFIHPGRLYVFIYKKFHQPNERTETGTVINKCGKNVRSPRPIVMAFVWARMRLWLLVGCSSVVRRSIFLSFSERISRKREWFLLSAASCSSFLSGQNERAEYVCVRGFALISNWAAALFHSTKIYDYTESRDGLVGNSKLK